MGGIDSSGVYVHRAQARHEPAAMLKLCAQRFVQGGYHLTGQGYGWLSALRHPVFDQSGLNQGHSILVATDGWNVTFTVRGQAAFGFFMVPVLDRAIGETLAAFDSWMVQHAVMQDAPVSQRAPVSVHVVEKQVVVTRCKYCRAHTPIDAPTCQSCGARGFS